jgi:hypothetical protein
MSGRPEEWSSRFVTVIFDAPCRLGKHDEHEDTKIDFSAQRHTEKRPSMLPIRQIQFVIPAKRLPE